MWRLCGCAPACLTALLNAGPSSISCCHGNARTMIFDGGEGTDAANLKSKMAWKANNDQRADGASGAVKSG